MHRSSALTAPLLASLIGATARAATVGRGDRMILDSPPLGRLWRIVDHPGPGDLHGCVPNDPPDTGTGSFGGIAHFSRASGAVMARSVSEVFKGGSRISAPRDRRPWVAHAGVLGAGCRGRLACTDPALGTSRIAESAPGCAAVAVDPDDVISHQGRSTLPSGVHPYPARVDPGAIPNDGVSGPMAAVGTDAVLPALRGGRGAVKSRHR